MGRIFAGIGLSLLLIGSLQRPACGAEFRTPALSPQELHERLQNPERLLVVDVRDPAEFRVGHVPGAINVPDSEIAGHLDLFEAREGVVLYCIAGTRTQLAERTLIDHGVPNVFHLDGGLLAWIDSEYAVEKGPGPVVTGYGLSDP